MRNLCPLEFYLRHLLARQGPDTSLRLEDIKQPTLILVGEDNQTSSAKPVTGSRRRSWQTEFRIQNLSYCPTSGTATSSPIRRKPTGSYATSSEISVERVEPRFESDLLSGGAERLEQSRRRNLCGLENKPQLDRKLDWFLRTVFSGPKTAL